MKLHRSVPESQLLSLGSDEKPSATALRSAPRKFIIPKRSEKGSLALGFAQQRLWFLDQLHPGSPLYNFPIAFKLVGQLNHGALEYALNAILSRHEALRTRFVCVEGSPVQAIDEPIHLKLAVVDLTHISAEAREPEAHRLAASEAKRPFNLAEDLMVRALLLGLGPQEHILVVTVHHIATDAWSMGIFFRELAAFYEARATGRAPLISELPIQYADFVVWQHGNLQGPVLETQIAYWKKQLAGATSFLWLPTDHPRPAVQAFRGGNESQRIPATVTSAIVQISRRAGVTPFMAYLAAFKVLLYRYSKQEDILVGCPIAGRSFVETEQSIGFFVNTLVMRTGSVR